MKTDISLQDGNLSLDISPEEMDRVGGFLEKLIPGFLKEGMGALNDQVKFWRWKRGVKLLQDAQSIIQSSGLPMKSIEPKLMIPIIENSSLESEETLHKKRVNMLANASTGKRKVFVSYTAILNELGSTEILLLDSLYDQGVMRQETKGDNIIDLQFATDSISKNLELNINEAKLIVDILFRLRLAEAPAFKGMSAGGYNPVLKTNDFFQLTHLGVAFIEACRF